MAGKGAGMAYFCVGLFMGIILGAQPLIAAYAPQVPTMGDLIGDIVLQSEPEPPRTMTAWTIANHSHASDAWCNYADSDTLTINAGGEFHFDIGWAGSDGSRDTSAITVNAGGVLVVDAGVRLDVNTGTAITVNEGGLMRVVGTEASRATVQGEDAASAGNKIALTGKLYATYADFSAFYYLGNNGATAFEVEMHNCTVSGMGNCAIYAAYNSFVHLYNCTITGTPASQYVIQGGYGSYIFAVNTAFTSTSDNYFTTHAMGQIEIYAGCTYRGAAIATNDWTATTCDYDIRIYSASAVTSNVAGAHWSLSHPLMDSTGMVYDSTNYMRVPGYLAYGQGNTTIYTLNWTAYWYSGLTVANRVYYLNNVSNGLDATSDKWNITASAWGYTTNGTEVYSGTDAEVNMTVAGTGATGVPGLEGVNEILTYGDGAMTDHRANFTWDDDLWLNGTIQFNDDLAGVYCNLTMRDADGVIVDWIANASWDFESGIETNLTEIYGMAHTVDTGDWDNGTYSLVVAMQHADIEDTNISTQFAILAALIPGLQDTAFVGTYDSGGDFRVNYTWGETIEIAGGVEWTYDLTGCYVNGTVRNAAGATVLWLGNWTETYTAGIAISLSTTAGAAINIDTADLENGSYVAVITFEHDSIQDGQIFGGFAIAPERLAAFNMSAYSDSATTIEANRFQLDAVSWPSIAYFNGTIEVLVTVPDAYVNITLELAGAYHLTLWNGTRDLYAGVPVNLTDLCGDVLNFTCSPEGDYRVVMTVERDGFLETQTVTEGFAVKSVVQIVGTGVVYKYGTFFEYDVGDMLTVDFAEAVNTEAPVELVTCLWNFGDGYGGSGFAVAHQYAMPGIYNVTLAAYYSDGTVGNYWTSVEVTDTAISWPIYAAVGCLVFAGLLIIGIYGARKRSKRVATAMYALLAIFLGVSVVAMQMFVA